MTDDPGRRRAAVTAVAFDDSFLQDPDTRRWSAPAAAPKSLMPTIFFLGRATTPLKLPWPRVEPDRELTMSAPSGGPGRARDRVPCC
jgi:hypothetical protein